MHTADLFLSSHLLTCSLFLLYRAAPWSAVADSLPVGSLIISLGASCSVSGSADWSRCIDTAISAYATGKTGICIPAEAQAALDTMVFSGDGCCPSDPDHEGPTQLCFRTLRQPPPAHDPGADALELCTDLHGGECHRYAYVLLTPDADAAQPRHLFLCIFSGSPRKIHAHACRYTGLQVC